MRRKNIVIAVLPALALTLLGVSIIQRDNVEPLFIHTTYYFLLAMVLCWAGVYIVSAGDLTKTVVTTWIKENKAGLALAVVITMITALAVHPALRILADETNLLGTSKNLFFSKTATFTTTGKWYYDNFWDAGVVIDRRPTLFPFLVSLIHVVRGYAYTNPFYLNLLLLPLFVFIAYRLAKSLGGELFGVVTAVLVVVHPITLISARSGGFDFLAAFFSLLIIKSLLDHCREPSANRLAIVWLNLCMFAEIRYESALFLAPVVFLLLVFRLVKLDFLRPYRFLYALSPLFFLPRIWQTILRGNVPEQEPGVAAFSLGYCLENARSYGRALFAPFDFHSPHATVVIALGLVGCAVGIHWLARRLLARAWSTPELQFAALVVSWMILQLIIVFAYVWGRSQHPAAARLYIAVDTFLSFPAAWVLVRTLRRFKPMVTSLLGAALFIIYLPVAAENRVINELTLTREAATTWHFFESLHENRILIVTDRPGLYTVMNYGALDFESAKRDTSLIDSLTHRLFYDIYIVQQIDLRTNKPLPPFDIWPDRDKQPVLEFQNDTNMAVRISRLAQPLPTHDQPR